MPTSTKLINMVTKPALSVTRDISMSFFLIINQAETPAIKAAPVNAAEGIVWKKVTTAVFCVRTVKIFVSSARPLVALRM
ncbi:unannotated protein [freshwater metagenome]|uniref:Unannotated protein n=1 Tax=freshwater metagenome TaxID=449393 RepID=A0A6J7IGX6_9ZZZZ